MAMKYLNDNYIAISPQFMVYSTDERIIIKSLDQNEEYVVSPVMGIILQWFTGEYKLEQIIEMTKLVFGEKINLIHYIDKINNFFGNFIITSNNKISSRECATIKISEISKIKPLYFEMLKANRLDGPKTIVFNVTNCCNFSCVYCHNKANSNSASDISFVSLNSLAVFLKQAKEKGCEQVILTGGDPMIHPNIFEIIKIINSCGIYSFLSTKTPISEDIMHKLLSSGLDEIQYSVDSLEDDVLKRLNVRSDISEICSSFDVLRHSKIKYKIKCVVTGINIKSIPYLLNICLSKKIYNIGFNLYSGAVTDPLVPSKKDISELLSTFKKYEEKGMSLEYEFEKKPHICGSLIHTLYLNENGDVSYCFKDYNAKELNLGNITECSLNDIWNSDLAFKFLTPEQHLFGDSECAKCKKFQKCIYYSCYYERYLKNGSPFSRLEECVC